MLNGTFYLDGVDARSVGIYLQRPIEFSEAIPIYDSLTVPGRNGNIILETGSFENRIGSASCFCLQKDVEKSVSSAGRFLMGKKGYRRLETSDDPDHYWMARARKGLQISLRSDVLAPFDVAFDCKPQRFLKIGDVPLVFEPTDLLGVNAVINNNYGFPSNPLIVVHFQEPGGFANVNINGKSCLIDDVDDVIFVDCETQNAYNGDANLNAKITCEEFPQLEPGENLVDIVGSLISYVEIVPRWWEL